MLRRGRSARLTFDVLEERHLLSVSGEVPLFRDLVSVEVIERQLFYNNSSFDGNDAGISAADDNAVPGDKVALLPGGTASFVNYSSYSRGINGIMIDVAGLPSWTLSAGDFEFRVGNVNDPASWVQGPAPTAISVRTGAGFSGSSRVEVIWNDGEITGKWLEVTLKATTATGLKKPDVFYFGSAVGESGNSAANAVVDAADALGAQNNPRDEQNPAPIEFAYDYNRDGLVNATDVDIANASATNAATALKLIEPPVKGDPPPGTVPLVTGLFQWGDSGVAVFNNPAIVTTNAGTVLAFAEARSTKQDSQSYAIVMRRSTDGGVTWSDPSIVYGVTPRTGTVISQPAPVVDKVTGKVFLLFNRGGIDAPTSSPLLSDVLITSTSDDGLTWSAPTDITTSVKVTPGNNPGPPGVWPDTPWGWIVVGPGHGIQLQHGQYAGRLLVGGDHRYTADTSGTSWSHVMYSDDHGETWHLGGGLPGLDSPGGFGATTNGKSNENTLVEVSNGNILMSSRVQVEQARYRGRSFSFNGGITFSAMAAERDLFVYQVQGSSLRLNDGMILYSSPASTDIFDEVRHEMSIWASTDEGNNWNKLKVIDFNYAGYSDMTLVGPDTILLTYARGRDGGLDVGGIANMPHEFLSEIAVVRINLRWLLSGEPYEFDWNFNEGAPGTPATSTGWSIQDYGAWDQRAWARASNPELAMQYVAGPANDAALHITDNPATNGVVLSPAYNTALYANALTSFTVQMTIKTSDANGVLIGTRPNIRNWTLQIVDGKLQFSLFDTVNTPTIISDARIDDGQWHQIVAVRDAVNRKLRIYIDGTEAAAEVVDTATSTPGRLEHVDVDAVYLGAYNSFTPESRLDFTIDSLRFTRAALLPEDFVDPSAPVPTPPPPKTYAENAPTSLPGLQLWMPPYDPNRYFDDYGSYAIPMSRPVFPGAATRSMIEASPNAFRLQLDNAFRQVLYAEDDQIGPYWRHRAEFGAAFGSEWVVHSLSSSLTPKNFDFVQNTGEFTLSTFLNLGESTGNYMTIFDTSEASQSKAGFSLFVQSDGSVWLAVTGGTEATKRFYEKSPLAPLARDQWYHLAVVGSGPGQPVKFYLTPVSANTVSSINSTSLLAGSNGDYATDANHELTIGGRAGATTGAAPFNGGLVNQAIFDQALTQQQIQQLFLFGKNLTEVPNPWQNPVDPLDVEGDGDVDARDVLVLANWVLLNPAGGVPAGTNPPPYYDVNGNNTINAVDVLQVINHLLVGATAAPAASTLAAGDVTEVAAATASETTPLASPLAGPASFSLLDVKSSDSDQDGMATCRETIESSAAAASAVEGRSKHAAWMEERRAASGAHRQARRGFAGCSPDEAQAADAYFETLWRSN